MTGVENILLAGVLLGMKRREAKRVVPEIIEVAELTDFANVPVKYYSSGMAARLAFSIAMRTDPEVLLLDEIFAVGDTHWLQRAEEQMKNLLDKAKVVIVVSHNVMLLRQLCARGIYLDHGQVRADGTMDEVARAYEQQEPECRTQITDNRVQSSVRLDCRMDGSTLHVTAESIPLFGECWIGLFRPEDDRDNYLAYRRVTIDLLSTTFSLQPGTAYEARLYRWTPAGETLEACEEVCDSDHEGPAARSPGPPADNTAPTL